MKHAFLVLAAIVPVLISCNERKEAVISCDIVRDTYCPDSTYIPLLQGNGVFGGLIESFGLQTRPSETSEYARDNALFNKTRSMRAGFGMDYLVPVARVYWKDSFEGVSSYSQRQSFYDGVVSTSFSHSRGDVKVKSWFDPEFTDAMFFEVSSSSARDIVIESSERVTTHYDQQLFQTVEISGGRGNWTIRTESPQGNYTYFVHSGFPGRVEDGKIVLSAKGNSYVSIVCNNDVILKPSASLRAARSYWRRQWNDYSFVFFGQENEQKAWVRFTAQILSNFTDKVIGLAPPMGLSGNEWPFAFPQDISYILPVFISSGHVELARSIVEYFAAQIPQMEEYTSRLVGQKGILCPWTMPYTTLEGYHDPQTPNIFSYETHNSGYLCRMAYETSLALNDDSWTKSNAYPLIKGCAEFYRSTASKGDDGHWHIFMNPGMGQDEAGGRCQMDYLCSLYSAQYCFETAVRCGLDDDGNYARILQDSLAFDSLRSPDGYYFSCKGSGPQDFGHQKHPVQLNPLAYLPVSNSFSPESSFAYEHRYDITERADEPYFFGWSLGEFMLASTRKGDRLGWQKDWDNMLPSAYTDPDFTQTYETSAVKKSSYYLTTEGLVLQSLLNNIADEWDGDIRLAGCVPPSWDKPVRFSSVFSKYGVLMSGTVNGQGDYDVTLKAWKDCGITVDGQSITLKKGQKMKVSSSFRHYPQDK